MAAPVKPWELNNLRNQHNFGAVNNFGMWPTEFGQATRRNYMQTNNAVFQPGSTTTAGHSASPPVPPRPDQQYSSNGISYYNRASTGYGLGSQSYMPYSPYMSYSSPYHSSMFGSYGGNYGYGNRIGYGNDPHGDGAFFRMAEESSRQAFQSIESIVQAFASVSMMMESTYHAVYSSFRAVIGVADHFSRLRNHLAQVLSTLALVRTLHWLYRKALYLLGLSLANPSSEVAWSAATRATAEALQESDLKGGRSSWPILMFLGVILGAPWLIWRVLASVTNTRQNDKWANKEGDHYVATALYDFQGEGPKELNLRVGQEVVLAPKALQPRVRGWLLGSVDKRNVGLVPANYVRILNKQQAPVPTFKPDQPMHEETVPTSAENSTDSNGLETPPV